jgi:hypothetical protein
VVVAEAGVLEAEEDVAAATAVADVVVAAVAPAVEEAEAVTRITLDRACSFLSLEGGWARRRYFFCSFNWPTESSTVAPTAGADSMRSTRPPL